MRALIDIYRSSGPQHPKAVTLDVDDIYNDAYGYQRLSVWNGHHGKRCFLPIHLYDAAAQRQDALMNRAG